MSRFYVPPEAIRGGKIYPAKKESHHISAVMRLKEGDKVTVFDGCGREYEGTIESLKNKFTVINIDKIFSAAPKRSVEISLAQALIKKDKLDYIVEKATELGVAGIAPIQTARTVARADKFKEGHKIEKWRKISIEAAKQCGRRDLPEIEKIFSFNEILKLFKAYNIVIMPCLFDGAISMKSALSRVRSPQKVLLLIGPEGDFTSDEIEKARQEGAVLVSLGELVLKSDTAAPAAIAMLNYEFKM